MSIGKLTIWLQLSLWLLLTTFMLQFCGGSAEVLKVTNNSKQKFLNDAELLRAIKSSMEIYEKSKAKQTHFRHKRSVKSVCYGELGCFEDSGPFAYLEMLPSPPNEINTKFFFYSTKNRSDRPLLELPFLNMTEAFRNLTKSSHKRSLTHINATQLQTTTEAPSSISTSIPVRLSPLRTFNSLRIDDLKGFDEMSVRVIVHGFGSACSHEWIYEMKTALMAVEDCIVICVDWENGATFPNYVRAATNTRLVGKQLAMLLNNLQEYKGLNLSRTHIIGFSLGAHVSGFAGNELDGLSRITGLDPAGPLFEAQHPKVRLDSTDAKFVDVIHSNGENLILGGLGSWQPMGDVDFYPNGGRVQTGCSNLFVGAVTDFIWSAQLANEEEGRSLCNHRRAYKFFIDSVAPRCLFPAFPCANYDDFLKGKCFPCAQNDDDVAVGIPRCGNMGYYADRSPGSGQLYLTTRDEEPFCAHQFQLKIFNSFNDLPLRTIGRLEAILEGEGGLNETFTISEKDDSEFFAGDITSKIIVPHPALGFPKTLSLNYKHYSGWLSKGLPHWDIDKVILTDSYGRSHSLCKSSTKLTSGSPVRMKLLPGNCELDNHHEYEALKNSKLITEASRTSIKGIAHTLETDTEKNTKGPQEANFGLNKNYEFSKNHSFAFDRSGETAWQPILENNFLDKEVAEARGGLSLEPVEIFEPVLNKRGLIGNKGRYFENEPITEEIMEPILKATTPKIKKGKELNLNNSNGVTENIKTNLKTVPTVQIKGTNKNSHSENNKAIMVQLFPFRLGEILQRAERYARETLLPLISIQAPRFFGFNFSSKPENNTTSEIRKPRYIPRYDEQYQTKKNLPTFDVVRRSQDVKSTITRPQRTILNLMELTQRRRPNSDFSYYTNMVTGASRALKPENAKYEAVFIDLPTYRPPKLRQTRSLSYKHLIQRKLSVKL